MSPAEIFKREVQRNDRDRKKIAVVATAHYLARVMLAMLKQNKPWMPKQSLTKAAWQSNNVEKASLQPDLVGKHEVYHLVQVIEAGQIMFHGTSFFDDVE